jgi:hypothetical protein
MSSNRIAPLWRRPVLKKRIPIAYAFRTSTMGKFGIPRNPYAMNHVSEHVQAGLIFVRSVH